MILTWLHISDIHYHYSSYESLRLREEFIKKIQEISNNTKIDSIFCTGDLADKNGDYSSELADYLESIAKSVGVIKRNVFIVPGNHDHDRNISKNILNNIYKYYDSDVDNDGLSELDVNNSINRLSNDDIQTLKNSFANFIAICNQFYENGNYNINSNVEKRTEDNFSVININTCLYDRSSDDRKRELHVGVKQLYKCLKESNVPDSDIKIAIGHHPTSILSAEEKKRFLDCLKSNNIHLYLCGHKHKPSFIYHSEYDIHEIICSYGNSDDYSMGGFSVGKIDTERNQYYVDFFNWKSGDNWVRDTTIDNCDETGRCYIIGTKYKHIDTRKIVIPIKLFGPKISNREISTVIGKDYEIFPYLSNEIDVNNVDWNKEVEAIKKFANLVKMINNKQINIFSLAPIPLLISFGYELQYNSELFLYQYDRDDKRWVNNNNTTCPKYSIFWKTKSRLFKKNKLIIKICTSTEISNKQLPMVGKADIIQLSLDNKKLGYPLYENHYRIMLRDLFDKITNSINTYNEIHLFASVPAGMAIEIGRKIQTGVFPKVYLYNYLKGEYTNTNIING